MQVERVVLIVVAVGALAVAFDVLAPGWGQEWGDWKRIRYFLAGLAVTIGCAVGAALV